MIQIKLISADGEILGKAEGDSGAELLAERAYQQGDVIEITSDSQYIYAQMDLTMKHAQIYLPNKKMTWRVPFGEERNAYYPGAFETKYHIISATIIQPSPNIVTDLACNPADLRGDTDFYPHCTANVETRNEACFCARNVIDGFKWNTYHGEWPFESWGIGTREDAWCRLDFGREVEVELVTLVLRADFPHDAYWTGGHLVMSDGTDEEFTLEKTGEEQVILHDFLRKHKVSWMRLERLQKSDDPSAFPALRSWIVYGYDKGAKKT